MRGHVVRTRREWPLQGAWWADGDEGGSEGGRSGGKVLEKTVWRSREREAELHRSERTNEDWQEDKAGRAAGGQDPKLHWCRGVDGQLFLRLKSSRCFQCPSPPPLSLSQTASTSVPFSTEELPPSPQLLFPVTSHQRLLCPCHPDSEPPCAVQTWLIQTGCLRAHPPLYPSQSEMASVSCSLERSLQKSSPAQHFHLLLLSC